MRRYLSFRYIIFYCISIFALSFYIYNLIPHNSASRYARNPSWISDSDNTDSSTDSAIKQNKDHAGEGSDIKINVRENNISIGENVKDIINKLGSPGRIDETEYNFDFYIYNNDYRKLLFIAIADGKVSGIYTDSLDFDYNGIKTGSTLSEVCEVLKDNFSLNNIIEYKSKNCTVQIFMDTLESQKVTGIYILSDGARPDKYTDKAMRNIELMIYDLTNSIRVRNGLQALSWSSSAALASRKHSMDMAENNFFSHRNLKNALPEDRLRAHGIYVSISSENIVAGYDSIFISMNTLFNSKTHRNNILKEKIRYTGVGFVYDPDSKYISYITQSLYR